MPPNLVSDRRLLFGFAALIVAVMLAGCPSAGPPRPKTVKVTGKVLYKNQPVSGASVAFLGDGQSVPALGRTDAEGRFELTTFEPGDGAVPGTHKITVSKIIPPKSSTAPATGVASMEAAAKAASDRGNQMPTAESSEAMSLLPEKYSLATTSNLSREVKASGANDITLELED